MERYVEAEPTKSRGRIAESKMFLPSSPHFQKSPLTKAAAGSYRRILQNAEDFGVPYGSRTRVAAVKEKPPMVIQRNLAAWIALYRTLRTHRYAYWTLSGLAIGIGFLNLLITDFESGATGITWFYPTEMNLGLYPDTSRNRQLDCIHSER